MNPIQIKVDESVTLSDVQYAFAQAFPCLQIRFYHGAHAPGEGSPAGELLDVGLAISDAGCLPLDASERLLAVDPRQTISDFEKMIKDKFALNVQVFRKSGNLWLQTISTDHWTLAEADRKGRHSSQLYQEKYGN